MKDDFYTAHMVQQIKSILMSLNLSPEQVEDLEMVIRFKELQAIRGERREESKDQA